jgi:hypothetical protein
MSCPRGNDKDRIASPERQPAAKDEQLAAKDRQIEQLIKKPSTVNSTTNQYI